MGLDISVYKNLVFKRGPRTHRGDNPPEWDNCQWTHLTTNPEYREQARPYADGFYSYEQCFSFAAGSYHGYNAWREELSMRTLGAKPKVVWANLRSYAGQPFLDLINFSDCEGFIGPVASARMAEQFEAALPRWSNADSWWLEKANLWHEAFVLAAQHQGVVAFR